MCAKHYENATMLSQVTAKNVGDVIFETHCIYDSRTMSPFDQGGKPGFSLATSVLSTSEIS